MDRQITETPRELNDRELELVAGGGGGGGCGCEGSHGGGVFFNSSRGNTSGLLAIGLLNGDNINILGFQNNIG